MLNLAKVTVSILHKKLERKVEKLPVSNINLGLGGHTAD